MSSTLESSRETVDRLPRRRETVTSALLVSALVAFLALLIHPMGAQQASRYALTAALWDDQQVSLTGYEDVVWVDRAERDGTTYSDKAPGQPVLGVPAYAAHRLAGGAPATAFVIERSRGLWAVTLVSAVLPAAALLALLRREAATLDGAPAGWAALAVSGGTLLLPFAAVLFGHVLAALLLFAGHRMARDGSARLQLIAGLSLGTAVAVEYPAVLGAVVVAGVAWRRGGHRVIGRVVAGAAPPLLLLALYQWIAFGAPWRPSYRASVNGPHDAGLGGFPAPTLGGFLDVMVGVRGLLVVTPVVGLALLGAWWLWRRRPEHRGELLVAAGVLLPLVALASGWSNPTGGFSPGPRYLVPALPFLIRPVAAAFVAVPRLSRVVSVVGIGIMVAVTATRPLVDPAIDAWSLWWSRVAAGEWVDTIVGAPGVVVPLSVLLAVVLATTALRRDAA